MWSDSIGDEALGQILNQEQVICLILGLETNPFPLNLENQTLKYALNQTLNILWQITQRKNAMATLLKI